METLKQTRSSDAIRDAKPGKRQVKILEYDSGAEAFAFL